MARAKCGPHQFERGLVENPTLKNVWLRSRLHYTVFMVFSYHMRNSVAYPTMKNGITLPHPMELNAARSSMRLRCGGSGGFGQKAPYFFIGWGLS